jgi:predicted AAA+ superfamily ATPase
LFFDLGLRRLAAFEQPTLPEAFLGALFEQFVGLELIRWARLQENKVSLHFWRDLHGPEVDWLIQLKKIPLPLEVKPDFDS